MNNETRADRALKAVEAYVGCEYRIKYIDDPDAFGEMVIDLLCDLRHLCARRGVSFEDYNGMASSHYDEEVREEGPCELRG